MQVIKGIAINLVWNCKRVITMQVIKYKFGYNNASYNWYSNEFVL